MARDATWSTRTKGTSEKKRDPRLEQLSRDHHRALVLARHAGLAAADPDPNVPREAWKEIVEKLDADLLPHFEIEEQFLLPPLESAGETRSVARVLKDHQTLRRLVDQSPEKLRDCLTEFGSLLAEHVRFQERVLFPLAESWLTDRELETIAAMTPGGPEEAGSRAGRLTHEFSESVHRTESGQLPRVTVCCARTN